MRPPAPPTVSFKNIVCRGHIQEDGSQKISKSLQGQFFVFTLSAVTCLLSGLLSVMSKCCNNCALLFLFVYGKTKKFSKINKYKYI